MSTEDVTTTPDPAAPDGRTRRDSEASDLLRVGACIAGLLGYVYVIGWIVTGVRFAAARLPGEVSTSVFDDRFVFGVGLRTVILVVVLFVVLCVWAYATAGRRWGVHAQAWHDIVRKGGVGQARDDRDARERREAWEANGEKEHHRRRAEHIGVLARWAERLRLGPLARALRRSGGRHHEAATVPAPPKPPLATAPLGDRAVRVIAGFNIVVLSAAIALTVARSVAAIVPGVWWAILIAFAIVYVASHLLLTHFGPLKWGPHAHAGVWVVVVVAAALISAPVGVLILSGVGISTYGRRLARLPWPATAAGLVSSPLSWAGLVVLTLVGASFYALPPVSFPRVVVATASGQTVGGYLGRTSAGVYLMTCTPLADATSTNERVVLVAADEIKSTTIGGGSATVDSGQRASVASLALHALGIDVYPPTLVHFDLRARQGTCADALPSGLTVGTEDPALGYGVITGPAPPGGRARDGDPPIEQTTPPSIAALARRYQPTLLVTVADRNWPVSVGALLEDESASGQSTCLSEQALSRLVCPPTLADLTPDVGPDDFLRFPAPLADDPTAQFHAFENGQHVDTGATHQWLADPGLLDPWATAQIYFYYAGPVTFAGNRTTPRWPVSDPQVPSGLIGLQYWFYYPFNYYPTVVRESLMNPAPLAGDIVDTDLHQGDWEHVTVLLDPKTLTPVWLYTARHSNEGVFIPWTSTSLTFDQGHPIVQAAFGGHPSYPAGCEGNPRAKNGLNDLVSDWSVCGSGRFAFRASTTPLVDLARTSYACWEGHFGVATPTEDGHAEKSESSVQRAIDSYYLVAGPRSPLWQAENGHLSADGAPARDYGACVNGATSAETAAVKAGI